MRRVGVLRLDVGESVAVLDANDIDVIHWSGLDYSVEQWA